MSNIQKHGAGQLVGLFHGGAGLTLPKPFERDIFLFKTYIAGTTHVEDIEEIVKSLDLDTRLDFFREPDNKYDKRAIVIKTKTGAKVGYVPKKDNVIFSRLMDAGKLLFGKVSKKEVEGNWVRIEVGIYLNE